MKILVIYPNRFAAQHAAKEDTFGVPGVKFTHVQIRYPDEADALAGMHFDAVIGLDHCHADLRDQIKSRVRSAS